MARNPIISIDSIDLGPADLPGQLPRDATLLRRLPGPDRDGYALAALSQPIRFATTTAQLAEGTYDTGRLASADPATVTVHPDGSVEALVYGVVLAPRVVGDEFHPTMKNFPVALAYVLDPTQLQDPAVDFSKVHYAAVAFISVVDAGTVIDAGAVDAST